MKKIYKDLRLVLLVTAVAFILFVICTSLFLTRNIAPHDAHQWLHDQLLLTHEQDLKLVPIEKKFVLRKKELEAEILAANRELATAINSDGYYSDRVKQAVDKIHHAQGELQKATLEHLFDMHSVLTPEQRNKLNTLTTDALLHNP